MIGVTIIAVIIIILILEIQRYKGIINKTAKDVAELKEKLANIEEMIKRKL